MSVHTKKHPISAHNHNGTLYISHQHKTYAIPKTIANQYVVDGEKKLKKQKSLKKPVTSIKTMFEKLEK